MAKARTAATSSAGNEVIRFSEEWPGKLRSVKLGTAVHKQTPTSRSITHC